ncbi:hypothetical protein YC2023_031500 [Brassica napus]
MAHGAPRRDVPSLAPRAMAQYGARLEENFSLYGLDTVYINLALRSPLPCSPSRQGTHGARLREPTLA